ncbi:hypothetical protein GGI12_004578 [Dipsacomyces acuminosporus]|nr:hypothetical protein GGI12_004578 [Dipsacomyces acuminosporus]
MANEIFNSINFIPEYWPSKGAAFAVAAVFYLFGIAIIIQSHVAGKRRFTILCTLISFMLGGAYTARGVFVVQNMQTSGPYIAFSVLNGTAPNFINLVNYLLLIILLRSISFPPSKKVIKGVRILAVALALTFGTLSAAGAGLLSDKASLDQIKTASKLLKASVAGQVGSNLLFLILASYFLSKYEEARRYRAWVALIYIGGVLVLARNCVRIIAAFYPSVTFLRTSEAAWYCLDPLFSLLIIASWIALNLPARCYLRDPKLPFNSEQQKADSYHSLG